MFSLPHLSFQLKSVNISTILTSKLNTCVYLETCFLTIIGICIPCIEFSVKKQIRLNCVLFPNRVHGMKWETESRWTLVKKHVWKLIWRWTYFNTLSTKSNLTSDHKTRAMVLIHRCSISANWNCQKNSLFFWFYCQQQKSANSKIPHIFTLPIVVCYEFVKNNSLPEQ